MVSCNTGGRCVHKSLLCKNLNPCGNNRDCSNSTFTDRNREEGKGGISFGVVLIVIGAIVVGLFIIIQVSLVVRNENKLCGYSKQREQEDVTGSFVSTEKV